MPQTATPNQRPAISGKFFRVGAAKYHAKGITYGPFANNVEGEPFPSPLQAAWDLEQIRLLGANLLRVYNVPPRWLMDMADSLQIKLLVDIPWSKHLCFLESETLKEEARQAVRNAVIHCAGHPALFALSVVNEIAPDVVRWSGVRAVEAFIDELIDIAKAHDPQCLCTFANYPPTEYLNPRKVDFVCFNVYLHEHTAFENYMARLQMLAGDKPLLLGETGIDSRSEGLETQANTLAWQIESAFRSGLAGAIVYSYTDEWFKGGVEVSDWQFGLTTRTRGPKPAFDAVQKSFAAAPYFSLPRSPKVSIVVASYNGARTLRACLESLQRLNYPDYEVILVNDGSTDSTPQIAAEFPSVRYLAQPNKGLSAARNAGLSAALGEIIAYTDDDCRADEDWLYYLVSDLLKNSFAGIGGHNLLPAEDSPVAAAVMVSPGGPAHVMLTDRLAEHIPGCNMAFYKSALEEIGGFDSLFRVAGDDVDICWRLQQRGHRIGFSSSGFVWHYRRSTVRAYLKQQAGYGKAEALLVRRHPERFNSLGNSIWRGCIYTSGSLGVSTRQPVIYHGAFATGFFQTLYRSEPATFLMAATSLEYHLLITLPLLVFSAPFHRLFPFALASMALSLGVCVAASAQAVIAPDKRRDWSHPLVAMLFFLQPIARSWARYRCRLSPAPAPIQAAQNLDFVNLHDHGGSFESVEYWSEGRMDRLGLLKEILARLTEDGWQSQTDSGWSSCDVEIFGGRWASIQLMTAGEPHGADRQLLRCRLRSAWSLSAKLALCGMGVLALLIISLVQSHWRWIWFCPAPLAFFPWFINNKKRDLRLQIFLLIDGVAKRSGLKRLPPPEPPPPGPLI